MSISIPFDNTYLSLPDHLYTRQSAAPLSDPKLIAWNTPLAASLGIDHSDPDLRAKVFSGQIEPAGAAPLAQLYSGHQFGHYNPQLGDGRALLLGEVIDHSGHRRDIQLKGSGPTPYSRGGDGRAWLGPVLREYIVSEAMHALGIPTTRALAAVTTGDTVVRETHLPGAILTRIAASHIRVGTFQILAARQDVAALKELLDYTKNRHDRSDIPTWKFLENVVDRQARLIAQWMGVGFIHGVMNTDNCSISGETIDYGPCAFMDHYHPMQVFSSIDRYGRYAYGAQPDVIVWNMAQLATSLLPLEPNQDAAIDRFTQIVHAMPEKIKAYKTQIFSNKLGLTSASEQDQNLIDEFLNILAEHRLDFTQTFRQLTRQTDLPNELNEWLPKWRARVTSISDAQDIMQQANPAIIPRNHQIEAMIRQALTGDYTLFNRLNSALSTPFNETPETHDLELPPTPDQEVSATFCGT